MAEKVMKAQITKFQGMRYRNESSEYQLVTKSTSGVKELDSRNYLEHNEAQKWTHISFTLKEKMGIDFLLSWVLYFKVSAFSLWLYSR